MREDHNFDDYKLHKGFETSRNHIDRFKEYSFRCLGVDERNMPKIAFQKKLKNNWQKSLSNYRYASVERSEAPKEQPDMLTPKQKSSVNYAEFASKRSIDAKFEDKHSLQ